MSILIGSARFGMAALLLAAGLINTGVSPLASATPIITTKYYLNVHNSNLSGGPFGFATVTLSSLNKANVIFQSYTGSGYYFATQGAVAVNGSGSSPTVSSITGSRNGITFTKKSNISEDGFGNFSNGITISGGSYKNRLSKISFILTASNVNWTSATDVLTPNTKGNHQVAAHIGVVTSNQATCTNLGHGTAPCFAATGYVTEGSSPVAVAEPASLAVLGVGLLGLAWLSGRLRRRHPPHA